MSQTVLICDDAIFMRTMIGDILTQAGFQIVAEAETGVQAVEKYRQHKPDLVTMDIVMPDMGGIDAVREIVKEDPSARILMCLMCSAMGQQALVIEAIQAGAKDFVVKPFQPSRVLEAVQRVLG
jgi:two-component system, chemotaxis family, chemotaxis protein CheY